MGAGMGDGGQAHPDVLFRGVRVFDGVSASLSEPSNVLVRGNTIAAVSAQPVPAGGGGGREGGGEERAVIDGAVRVLMPGLIDAHYHAAFATLPLAALQTADPGYIQIQAAAAAGEVLLRGFTTVRDVGGPVFGLKRAIDEGITAGPRIYPSGAFLSQTSGHGDFRMISELPRGVCGHLTYSEIIGAAVIADGVPEVLRGVREQLMRGASQIKIMAGGGVASAHDPIDATQYTEAELRAGVEAAENWGTYVLVHAYTPRAVKQAIRAGVRCIDHGHLLDEETVAMMADQDIWWSMQPFLDDEDAIPLPGPAQRAQQLLIVEGTDRAYALARKHQVKLAWGTDTLFDAGLASRQGKQLAKMSRWFTAAETLRMATSQNAALLAMSGERNPYPGKLGVVAAGALADLLLIDGNPLEALELLATPATSLVVIMKDGRVCKNLL